MYYSQIVSMTYGSHLYGLSTETSDQDIKGVFMPLVDDILLGRIPKTIDRSIKSSSGVKNSKEDIDIEYYSLHNFINMACDGNTIALDMLHAPKDMLIITSPLWEKIVLIKDKFYSKRLQSYLGYARTQVSKYGKKGDRLNSALMVKKFLESRVKEDLQGYLRMSDIWHVLPKDQNVQFIDVDTPLGPVTFYEVCNRKIQETLTVEQAFEIVNRIVDKYGERTKISLEGTDWKAVTHALRACFQLKELYIEGTITFPLKECDFLMKVKLGQMDFEKDVSPLLDQLILEVETLVKSSWFPETVDREFWDNFVLSEVKKIL